MPSMTIMEEFHYEDLTEEVMATISRLGLDLSRSQYRQLLKYVQSAMENEREIFNNG